MRAGRWVRECGGAKGHVLALVEALEHLGSELADSAGGQRQGRQLRVVRGERFAVVQQRRDMLANHPESRTKRAKKGRRRRWGWGWGGVGVGIG